MCDVRNQCAVSNVARGSTATPSAQECIFKPVMVAQEKKDIEGRALKMATELTQVRVNRKCGRDGESVCLLRYTAVCQRSSEQTAVLPALCLTASQPQSKRSRNSGEEDASAQQARQGGPASRRPRSVRPPPSASGPGSSSASAAASPAPAQPVQHPARVPSGEQVHFDALERQINEALVRLSLSEEAVAASLRQAAEGGAAAVEAAADAAGAQGGSVWRLYLGLRHGCSADLLVAWEACAEPVACIPARTYPPCWPTNRPRTMSLPSRGRCSGPASGC